MMLGMVGTGETVVLYCEMRTEVKCLEART